MGYPPNAYVAFAPGEDGKPMGCACLHFYSLSNGAMPHDEGEDADYLHICGKNGLDDLIASLSELRERLYGLSGDGTATTPTTTGSP